MVVGFETFREAFKGYKDCYTIIGGTACDILLNEANLDFRATSDVDMILLIENRFSEFGKIFWDYIKAGEYKCGWKSSDELHFYRFTEPGKLNYPAMIELFSRDPGYVLHDESTVITPLHIDDEISSLSAIMLNDEYYQFMLEGRKTVNGIGLLDAEYIIPFKMRARNDLMERKLSGEHVNTRDLKKHKNDVYRLTNIINDEKVVCSEYIKKDIIKFIEDINTDDTDLTNFGVNMELDTLISLLRKKYL